jgi:hypothetical protein
MRTLLKMIKQVEDRPHQARWVARRGEVHFQKVPMCCHTSNYRFFRSRNSNLELIIESD